MPKMAQHTSDDDDDNELLSRITFIITSLNVELLYYE